MRIIVSTCDKYDHLLPGFAMQWNRYWGSPVTVLGFRPPPALPDNFRFYSMGEETKSWSEHVHEAISVMPDREIVFLFDDYWLTHAVDIGCVNRMSRWVREGCVKGDLSRNTEHFDHKDIGEGFLEATKFAQYRTSTQPAVWNREYLLSLLGTGKYNPWQFELQHSPESKTGRIIGTRQQIVRFANIYYKGIPAQYMIDLLTPRDLFELSEAGALDFTQHAP